MGGEKGGVESEVGTGSDREKKWPVLSLKLGQVQTEEGEIVVFESEVGSGSDREKGNGRC
ncbi:hypothetical protein [Cytobacillus firmus]|uniref:hypothetical protein n=1 Tax=Cytobacillus firmus TaxID=1399 RepID=UPI0018CE5D8A|nr:hypothetical protein [Cytobacillus firmus]MBG9587972.1 hypothetical protein [Cytobacillus firmus]